MYYILAPHIALRSWRLVPWAYYVKGHRTARGLKQEEFELLRLCDGGHDLPESALLTTLLERGMIRPSAKGGGLSDWQKYLDCDNRYFPAMNWMITGRCNFNCLHCFNAADNDRPQSEFSWEECEQLMDQAMACGVNAITITGGEPMLHPRFMEILRGIYRRGMYVDELNTNGSFLTPEILDEMQALGCAPKMKISFDGVGHHDWLRNRPGAETQALAAIRLCVEKGFSVKAQINVHRLNVTSMLPTLELLDGMGVDESRVIRTTEAPRWAQNAGDACLGLTEYYDRMLELAAAYLEKPRRMDLDIWQFLTVLPTAKAYRLRPVECVCGEYRDNLPVCRGNRGMVAVTAEGNVVPCHQMSGYYQQHGDVLGNVKTDGLQPLLQSGSYLNEVCATLKDLADHSAKCRDCIYFPSCAGGCRAIALALTGDKLAPDPAKCLYFEQGYPAKTAMALKGFRNLSEITGEEPWKTY